MRIGFIGLGVMGTPMVRRLLRAHGEVVVWNRTSKKLAALPEAGIVAVDSPRELMQRADLVGICVTSDRAVEEIAFGKLGLFSAPPNGPKVIADFSTGSAGFARSAAQRTAAHGCVWVDTPVSGGVPAAQTGKLIAFAGGDQSAIARLQPLLAPICARVNPMGPSGAGQTTKLCNQLIVAGNLMLIGQALAMARRCGVDISALPAALQGGFADSAPLQLFGPRMASGQCDPPMGSIGLMAKDVALALQMAEAVGAAVPTLAHLNDLYGEACKRADISSQADLGHLIRLFERDEVSR